MELTRWRLKDIEPSSFDESAPAPTDSDGWIDIAAPGDVYLALHEAGRLPHPFDDRREKDCSWVRDREWRYRTSFAAPAHKPEERVILAFEGLDTFARVWLNGALIARSDNMFRRHEIDVTRHLTSENTLEIAFTPTADVLKDKEAVNWGGILSEIKKTKRNMVRKAQYGWGWDWGPNLPTVGIWRPVTVIVRGPAWLHDVTLRTTKLSRDGRSADIAIAAKVEGSRPGINVHTALRDPSGHLVLDGVDGGAHVHVEATLEDPKLWWTHDLGEPSLYRLTVELRDGDTVLDAITHHVGIRTIELDTSPDPDEPGTSFFRFILNGVPIFARGGCWIPASSFIGALDHAFYRPLIEAAVEGNNNMLRIWGGGIYEHEAFYELCDRLGVLVWQDFMFACAPYPQDDPVFADSVKHELEDQIRRLRHHPSIALWCGNNEVQTIHEMVPKVDGVRPPLDGRLYFDVMMPEMVTALDPTTPYWAGSPWGGPAANSMRAGDVHDWTVWHGVPPIPDNKPVGAFSRSPESIAYTRYAEDMGRFISEFGIHASPALETLKGAMPASELRYGSEALNHRIKDHPKDKVNGMLVSVTGIPDNIQDYVDFTQITQAEGLKFGIEHFRRRMPHCSGTLIWQFNDCWPCVSWSVLDYNGYAKAGFYYVRRAYSPVLASFRQLPGGEGELWITNETQQAVETIATVELGDLLSGEATREEVPVNAAPYSSRAVWKSSAITASPRLYLNVRSDDDAFPENRLFFAPIKDLERHREARPVTKITRRDADTLDVEIAAPQYLYFTHLIYPSGTAKFSDNHFDLRKGQRRTITVREKGIDPAKLVVRSV